MLRREARGLLEAHVLSNLYLLPFEEDLNFAGFPVEALEYVDTLLIVDFVFNHDIVYFILALDYHLLLIRLLRREQRCGHHWLKGLRHHDGRFRFLFLKISVLASQFFYLLKKELNISSRRLFLCLLSLLFIFFLLDLSHHSLSETLLIDKLACEIWVLIDHVSHFCILKERTGDEFQKL